jgi:hypothetical protein
MEKSGLKKIIKEEITKVLQEEIAKVLQEKIVKILQEKKREGLQTGIAANDLVGVGVPTNIAPKVIQVINKLRNPKGIIGDVPLSNEDNKALARVLVTMLASEDISKLNNLLNKIKATKTITTDVAG